MDESQLQSYINKIQEIRDISVSNMTTKEMAEFDSLQVQAYADALSDVESKQSALLLSTQGLNTAQIAETLIIKEGNTEKAYQAMVEAGLLKSKQELSNANLQNAIASVTNSEAKAKETMKTMGLAVAIEGEEAQTVQLTSKKLQLAVSTGMLTQAEAQQIAMTTGVTLAQKAQATIAMPQWIANMKAMTVATWGQVKATATWLVTNPVGWCVLAIGAIAGVAAALIYSSKAAERAKEKIDEMSSEYENGVSELQSLEQELESVNQKIDELQSKGKLSFTDAEELENLKAQNAELERQIDLQTKINQQKANDIVAEIRDGYDSGSLSEDFEKSINNYTRALEELKEYEKDGLEGISLGIVTQENFDTTIGQYSDTVNDYYASLLDDI